MPLLSLESVSKSFGVTKALDDVSFALTPGSVHVLLGANGSGKSTLSKVISGVYAADSGAMQLRGVDIPFDGPRAMQERGVGVVYQELSLIPTMSVGDNLTLGIESRRVGCVDVGAKKQMVEPWLDRFRRAFTAPITVDTPIADLPPDEQQLLEIIKVLIREPAIIIFDEATAALRPAQVDVLFSVIQELQRRGCGIIYITHKMEEIFRVGTVVTILRNGRRVTTQTASELSHADIVRYMVGDLKRGTRSGAVEVAGGRRVVLSCTSVSSGEIHDVSFQVHESEVLGLGGLSGQGQTGVLRALFGDHRILSGTIRLDGASIETMSVRRRVKRGIGYVSGDRKREAAFLNRSIRENGSIAALIKGQITVFKRSRFDGSLRALLTAQHAIYRDLFQDIGELSGGNQQKTIVARWILSEPRVMLLDDPTKGIDIKAKEDLYRIVRELCRRGVAVVWSSSDDDELLANTDRIVVMNGGCVAAELDRDTMTKDTIYKAALK